ncbi:hypothetical protein SDC9_147083 [bioreactor metagenome]|uniref:Uncharacterized protein n=1 Tax=bioreactor metagenome TaxID=1076179 RepID=A0A645EFK2_9ZZZZ
MKNKIALQTHHTGEQTLHGVIALLQALDKQRSFVQIAFEFIFLILIGLLYGLFEERIDLQGTADGHNDLHHERIIRVFVQIADKNIRTVINLGGIVTRLALITPVRTRREWV